MINQNILIGYRNEVDTAKLSASSEAITVNNLADYRPSVPWRSASLLHDPTPSIKARFKNSVNITLCALWAHNLSLTATIRLFLWADSAATQLVYDSGLIYAWEPAIGAGQSGAGDYGAGGSWTYETIAGRTLERFIYLPNATVAKAATLQFFDSTSVNDYVQLGRWYIGTAYQPAINFRYGAEISWIDPGRVQRTESGGVRFQRRPKFRQLTLSWDDLSQEEALMTWDDIECLLGTSRDLFVSLLPTQAPGIRMRNELYCAPVEQGGRSFSSGFVMSKKILRLQELL